MTVERWLQIHIAAMAALATLALGLNQRGGTLAIAMILVAITSVIFTDVLGWFRLHRLIANIAMLLAAVFSLNDFFRADSDQQLRAIANLLIYVQIVLLYHRKSNRIYGQIAVFSLLQIVVAALLNEGFEFGVLLLVYVVVSFFALSLFFVHRESLRFQTPASLESTSDPETTSADPSALDLLREAFIGERPRVSFVTAPAEVSSQLVGWRLARQIVAMWLTTLAFAVVFFYGTPRTKGGSWRDGGLTQSGLIGFSPEVTLDEMGQILSSDSLVMRVVFTDQRTAEPYLVIGDPYFRGAVLTNYLTEGSQARWKRDVASGRNETLLQPAPQAKDVVRQEVYLEPTSEPLLFSVFPVYASDDTPEEIRFDTERRLLLRGRFVRRGGEQQYRYSLDTSAFRFGAQVPFVPHVNRAETPKDAEAIRRENTRLTYIPNRDRFPKLIELANSLAAETGEKTTYRIARALESHFHMMGNYTYTLDFSSLSLERNHGLDPIEDFVANHHKGHCEYFASALVMMLRSQNIPARMVIGYKSGEYNYLGKYFLVRQRHAHAWVEAYLPREEIPENTLSEFEIHDGGAWFRLDPTPGDTRPNQGAGEQLLDRITKSFDYAQWLWNDYVLRLTPDRQLDGVSKPLPMSGTASLAEWLDRGRWRRAFQQLIGGDDQRARMRGLAILVGVVALILVVTARRMGAFLPGWRWPIWRRGARRHADREHHVEFYEKLETLLASIGMVRPANQTQREFAAEAAGKLAADSADERVASIPTAIVRRFYQVRFGQYEPSSTELDEIQSSLVELERGIVAARERGVSSASDP